MNPVRYHFVGPEDPLCTTEDLGSAEAEEFFEEIALVQCGGAVVARSGQAILGWLRFEFEKGVLYPGGTWVESPYRGLGIAQTLWGKTIKRLRPKRITVRTITREGRRLVGSAVSWFPNVEFEVLT